jgi:hypothetical protein
VYRSEVKSRAEPQVGGRTSLQLAKNPAARPAARSIDLLQKKNPKKMGKDVFAVPGKSAIVPVVCVLCAF